VIENQFADITPTAKKMLAEYDLCDFCLGRMFAKKLRLQSNRMLGKKLHTLLKSTSTKCYICKNLFDAIPYYVQKMLDVSSGYEFETFLVGAKLRPSVLDRDDHIRSKFQIRVDAVKTNMTREIAKRFARRSKKRAEFADPDVVFTIDFKDESCTIQSRPIFMHGRYTKRSRNIPQKQRPCANCKGKGCVTCNHHGIAEFDSVEGAISQLLFERFGAIQAKITWIGGEDATSLVLGSGRPFFVKLLNPKRRKIRLPEKVRAGQITILGLKLATKIPNMPLQFESDVLLTISSEMTVDANIIDKLGVLENSTVAVYDDSGKRSEKVVRNVKYETLSQNSFALLMTADGGLPLKHFVSGDNVFPNITDLLGIPCRCDTFDFKRIRITNQHFLHHS
jgi:tRNA pseudouridine synthase 10